MRFGRMAMTLAATLSLISCAVPNTYSTLISSPEESITLGGYAPFTGATIKAGFINELAKLCSGISDKPEEPEALHASLRSSTPSDICEKKSPTTDFACWATTHTKAKRCVDAVARHAVHQCVMLVGQQNRLAARLAEWLFPLTSILGLGADIAAITTLSTSKTSNSAAVAALTGTALSNSGTVQKAVPSTVSVKTADLASSEANYIIMSNFKDEDVDRIATLGQELPSESGKSYLDSLAAVCSNYNLNDKRCNDYYAQALKDDYQLLLNYSYLHDNILATCPANNR